MKLKSFAAALAAAAFAAAAHAQTNHYVSLSGGNNPPYTSWATAATTIQAAIDASGTNDIIWVTNGVYDAGGTTNYATASGALTNSALTNRVSIYKPVTVCSVNGPSITAIKGAWDPSTLSNGPAAVRCVHMGPNSKLIGFTVTNGATLTAVSGYPEGSPARMGGGIYAVSPAVVSNCFITRNICQDYGGGVAGGTVYNCDIYNNVCCYHGGGGARGSVLYNCRIFNNTAVGSLRYGGGIYGGRAHECLIYDNWARDGGGARDSYLYNCRIFRNTADYGGGAQACTMYNCEIEGNTGGSGGGIWEQGTIRTNYNCTIVGNKGSSLGGVGGGGGIGWVFLYNCIVYDNSPGNFNANATFFYSNSSPLPPGPGNIDADPQFVAPGSGYGPGRVFGDLRLTRRSPCMNAGMNFPWQEFDPLGYGRDKDLDGNPRVRRGVVDMGAYEIWVPRGSFFTAE